MKDTKQIIRELVEEVIEEMTATGAVAGYQTKFAFGKGDRTKKIANKSIPGGTVVGKKESDDTSVEEGKDGEDEALPIVRRGGVMEEGYKAFARSEQMSNRSKAPYLLTQARRSLREAEYLIKICERFMTERGYTNENMWTRTEVDLKKMQKHLIEISNGLKRLSRK